MLLLTAIVSLAAVWFTGEIEQHENAFYACLLLIAGGAIGAFASLDLFFFYAFHELALIPTFLLIGIWGTGNRTRRRLEDHDLSRARQFHPPARLDHALSQRSRSSAQLRSPRAASGRFRGADSAGRSNHIYLLLLIGFGILISLFPVSHLGAGSLCLRARAGGDVARGSVEKIRSLRLAADRGAVAAGRGAALVGLLLILLLANIIYVGLVTIAQKRLDWMLGYSSVMHMGYIFLGIASANILGPNGAAMLMFAHGLSIALLFAIAGELRERVPSLDFDAIGRPRRKQMPLAAFAFGLGAFAAIGLPGFANFAAEIMVIFGAFRNGFDYQHFHIFQWATRSRALGRGPVGGLHVARLSPHLFGSSPEPEIAISDIRSALRFPIALLVVVSILFGFFPQIAVQRIAPAFRNYFSATQ